MLSMSGQILTVLGKRLQQAFLKELFWKFTAENHTETFALNSHENVCHQGQYLVNHIWLYKSPTNKKIFDV